MPVCRFDELSPEHAVAAMVDGRQVGLFRTYDGQLYAVSNRDPVSRFAVIPHGIVGSPDEALPAPLAHVRVVDGCVEVEL